MLLRDIKAIFHKELDGNYGREEVDSFFYLFLEHYLKLERFTLVLQPGYTLTKEEEHPFFEGLSRLKNEEPVQHILGKSHFMDFELIVNKNVLIPRPETEELVNWVISEIEKKDSEVRILDLGTGSGCIAIALAKVFPQAQIYALDISEEALGVATANAELNGVDVVFIRGDILNLNLDLKFDVILSNPPYVRELEKARMQNNVIDHEPSSALFVSDTDPLVFYRAIVAFANTNLMDKGKLYFEINQYLANETKALLVDNDFEQVELRKDIFGNFRMLKGIKA